MTTYFHDDHQAKHAAHRILWNRRPINPMRGDCGEIDEIVIRNAETVHIEQMDTRCWWIGIYMADGTYWMGNFIADSRGRMRFSEQENAGIEWQHDATHEPADDEVLSLAEADALAAHLRLREPEHIAAESHTRRSHARREAVLGRPVTGARPDGTKNGPA